MEPSSLSQSCARQPLTTINESLKAITIPFPKHEDSSAFPIDSLLNTVSLADQQLDTEKKKTKKLYRLAISILKKKIKELCQDQQNLQLANRELQDELNLERIAHQALVENLKKQLDSQQEEIGKLNQELADSKQEAAETILIITKEKEVAVLTATKAAEERVECAAKNRWRVFLQSLRAKHDESLTEYYRVKALHDAYPQNVHHKCTWYQVNANEKTCRDILTEARKASGFSFEYSHYRDLTERLERRT